MNDTRRKLLLGSAAVVAGISVGGMGKCSMVPVADGKQILQPVIDAIQAGVATFCGWVPNVATLITLALSAFPALVNAITVPAELLKEAVDFLCSLFHGGGGTQAAIASVTAAATPGLKGTLKDGAGIDLHGYVWDAATNKFVAF